MWLDIVYHHNEDSMIWFMIMEWPDIGLSRTQGRETSYIGINVPKQQRGRAWQADYKDTPRTAPPPWPCTPELSDM